MNRHASMNRIFRLVWNESLDAYVPAAETARGRGKNSKQKLIAAALSLTAGIAQGGPTGGQLSGGSGTITQSGSTTTIQQSSQNLSLNWQTFNVGSKDTVDFVQPNSTAIAVNRIFDTNGSVILGHLNANGQVYLINPSGVLFGKGAEVNVGGLVASTLDLNGSTLGSASETFSGAGAGSVVNEGSLTATSGGSIALLGNHVSNTGVIGAQLGSVALGAGSAATLKFNGSQLVSMQIDRSVLNSVAVNGGLIQADGGHVLMTAGAQKSLLASVVNNTGIIEARTIENHDGTITLLGGMSAGSVDVGGTLDASAAHGGNGGAIETSAAHVQIADSAKVTTAASLGLNGTWLIDPTDFTISSGSAPQSASGIGAVTLEGELANTNVSIATSAGGSQNGDINVNAPVSWSANLLTLTAANNINVNAIMTMSGTAKVDFEPGAGNLLMGFAPDGSFAGRVDITSNAVNALIIGGHIYTVINSLGNAGDATNAPTAPTLQGMAAAGNLGGHFALGSNIDASSTSGWNGGAGFTPIGNSSTGFNGTFDGLGHTISSPVINQPNNDFIGLFGFVDFGGALRNIGVVHGSVYGSNWVGGLAGFTYGSISNSYTTGAVTALASGAQYIGGLAGDTYAPVINSHSASTVTAGDSSGEVGGLIGESSDVVSQSYATGSVTGGSNSDFIGGLIGLSDAPISSSHAMGAVTGGSYVGGLVGQSASTVSGSHAVGNVTSPGDYVGGLIGESFNSIDSSYAIGTVSGANYTGGLVGYNIAGFGVAHANITASFATGSVTGGRYTGGLVGINYGAVNNSYAAGSVNGTLNVGGLVGMNGPNSSAISNSYATGSVSGAAFLGGLVGAQLGAVTNSFYAISANPGLTGFGNSQDAAGTVMALTSAQLQSQANFVSSTAANGGANPGWDFASTWTMYEGQTTPLLQVFMTPLTVIGTVTQTYNGAAFAPAIGNLSYSIDPDLSHLFGSVTVTGTAVGARHVGTYTFTPGGLYSNQLGYMISYSSGSLTIYPAPLTVLGSTASKVYDGTTVARLTGGTLVGLVAGDTVTLTQNGTFASMHAGTGIAVNASDSIGGASAGDYALVQPTGLTGTITPATLTVSGTTVGTKVYSGTSAATLARGTLVGLIGSDSVTLNQSGSFTSKNVGTGVSVTATDSIGGARASDYTLVEPIGLTGTITPATLTVSGTTVGTKVYDGTDAAALAGGALVGVVGGDSVTLKQSGTFASASPGTEISVTATDTLSGANASNYRIAEPTGLSGAILPASSSAAAYSSNSVLAAVDARTQIVENFIYPQLGANPQLVNPSPTIEVLTSAANETSETVTGSHQATSVNVSMKIGATGTLRIESGGLRLPSNLAVGDE